MLKFLRVIGVIILVVILIPLIAAFFIKKDYHVERSVVIEMPRDSVFNYVVMLKNQDNYSAWSEMDSKMKNEYRGTDGTVGFVSAWESDNGNTGKGEQEITAIIPGERIDYQLRFIKPFKSVSDVYMITEDAAGGGTLVRWGFTGRMNYPVNILLLLMSMEESIGNDFDTGLQNLKNKLE